MTDRSFLFIHSPLVGPSSLRRVADAATAMGFNSVLPDLTSIATAARPHAEYIERAVEAARSQASPPVVVGHSGAGVFLPTIGYALGSDVLLLFLDAVIPPKVGAHVASDSMKRLLDEQAEAGLLRRWIDWWPVKVRAEILPDETDRDLLSADMPRLPRSFYDVEVDVPPGWSEGRCAYLRLSAAYDAELDEAIARDWPTATLASTHLGMHSQPNDVLAAIMTLVDEVTPVVDATNE